MHARFLFGARSMPSIQAPPRGQYLLAYGNPSCNIDGHACTISINNDKHFDVQGQACFFNDHGVGYALPMFDSRWHMITVTLASSTALGYVDGKKFGWTHYPSPWKRFVTDASDLSIEEWSNEYFDGLIDDVRIYNRALSEAEIKQLYQIESQPPVNPDINGDGFPDILFEDATGQVGYWSMQGGDMMTAESWR
jgi:hypothetical protein